MTDSEINEAVARKLGWTYHEDATPLCWEMPTTSTVYVKNYPDYYHSIQAAWEILTDHCDTWEIYCNGSTVDVTLSKNYDTAGREADTAPMAICLAFLKLP